MERKTKPTMHPHKPARKHAFGNVFGTTAGTTASQNGAVTTDLGYTGQRQEPELGLYYYNARWYDPYLGRFTQPDTIVPNPTDAKAFDRYAYVNNNPVMYSDPSGHCVESNGQETGQGGVGYACPGSTWKKTDPITSSGNSDGGTETSAEPDPTQGGGEGAGLVDHPWMNPSGELEIPARLIDGTYEIDENGFLLRPIEPCNEEYTKYGVANGCRVINRRAYYYAYITSSEQKMKMISVLNNQEKYQRDTDQLISYGFDVLALGLGVLASIATGGVGGIAVGIAVETVKFMYASTSEADRTDALNTQLAGFVPSPETPILVSYNAGGWVAINYQGTSLIEHFTYGTNRDEFLGR